MSNYNPLITILTVVKNSRNLIEKTIQSVAIQSYQNIEYIVIDGGSNDGTIELINQNLQSINTFISEEDGGIYDAMNKGLKIANGEWIYFLNAGDIFYGKEVVKRIAENIIKNIKADIIYGNFIIVHYEKKNRIKIETPERINKNFFLNGTICQQAVIFKKTVFDSYGIFRIEFKIVADFDRLLHIFMSGCKFKKINLTFSEYLEGGYSRRHYVLSNIERLKAIKLRCGYIGPFLYIKHALNIFRAWLNALLSNKYNSKN
jgi:glycosyltransferase involved in cell wall biosynthesis